MQATVEISLNPLTENYEQIVVEFIMRLKKYNGLRIDVNGLSTQIFGDYDRIMDILKNEMKRVLKMKRPSSISNYAGACNCRKSLLPASVTNIY